MGVLQILRLLGMAVAFITAFVAVPEAVLILTVMGLVVGVMGDMEDNSNRVYWLIIAMALTTVSGAASPLPVIGGPISDIMGNMSTLMNALALGILVNAMKERIMNSW
ncbi:MAG: hypothetical protein CMK25_10455 [Porticoccaceae bacterium]|nr:hypothetical protein [Porticoccaceae bacterium]MDG2115949.1 hypothetical protein [Porticoccaceae bacterium]